MSGVTLSQILIVVLLGGLLTAFASDRFRADNVAVAGLMLGVVLGLVPTDRIFSGLINPAVVTVLEVLLIVHALGRSHVFDRIGEWLNSRFTRPLGQIIALCGVAACLSSVMNNVAAFSLMLPACFSMMAKGRLPARWIFLPLSYATLLGGLWTSIGTPANLVASAFLQQSGEEGFALLDFAPAGVAVTAVGLLVLALWLPRTLLKEGEQAEDDSGPISWVMTELRLAAADPGIPSVADLEALLDGHVHNIVRDGRRVFPIKRETILLPADRLLVEAEPKALNSALRTGRVSYSRQAGSGERRRVRAVVMPHSLLAGSSIAAQDLDRVAVEILQVEGEPVRFEGPFEELSFRAGSILLLEGDEAAVRSFIAYNELVEVADSAPVGVSEIGFMPLAVFALGVMAAGSGLVATEIALAAVVAILCLAGKLDLRAALRNLNWPIIVILVAMLPLGEAVGTTGAAAAIATFLTEHLPMAAVPLAVFVLLGIAMVITPFVNNVTAVAILAPIAVELAHAMQLSPQMLVMAVAVGASCDFLTPFGHHNNTLAYGLGPYRFRDFLWLGWPLSLATFGTAGVVLLLYW
nr:cation transporter [Rhizobium sp. Q54]